MHGWLLELHIAMSALILPIQTKALSNLCSFPFIYSDLNLSRKVGVHRSVLFAVVVIHRVHFSLLSEFFVIYIIKGQGRGLESSFTSQS